MSKSITEKELAEKLGDYFHLMEMSDDQMLHVARRAAELLGVEMAPGKPEPGTWHVVTGEGAYANQSAYVGGYGNLLIFADNGDYDNLAADMLWPDLTPARVVRAEHGIGRVEVTREQVWDALVALDPAHLLPVRALAASTHAVMELLEASK